MKRLNGTWRISSNLDSIDKINNKDIEWLQVKMPADTYSALMRLRKIENPYFSNNLEKLTCVENNCWWFKKVFRMRENARNKKLNLV